MFYSVTNPSIVRGLVYLTITATQTPTRESVPKADLIYTLLIAMGVMLVVSGFLLKREKVKKSAPQAEVYGNMVLK